MAITKIQTVTVGSGGSATIDFNSIPGTYTDLLLVLSGRGTSPSDVDNGGALRANGSSSGYGSRDLYGAGSGNGASSVNPYSLTTAAFIGATPAGGSTANTFSNKSIYISNYTGSTVKNISVTSAIENNATLSYLECINSYWTGTAAITSLSLSLTYLNYAQYSSATLYGITKGSSGGVTVS